MHIKWKSTDQIQIQKQLQQLCFCKHREQQQTARKRNRRDFKQKRAQKKGNAHFLLSIFQTAHLDLDRVIFLLSHSLSIALTHSVALFALLTELPSSSSPSYSLLLLGKSNAKMERKIFVVVVRCPLLVRSSNKINNNNN